MKKKFTNRTEYEQWYSRKEQESRDIFQKNHPEFEIYEVIFGHSEEWGMNSEEDVYTAAEQDGYDVNHLSEQIKNLWGEKKS